MEVQAFAKPIVAFVDGMMASAGMWVGSQTNAIVMLDDHVTSVGSVGVLQVHSDRRKSWLNAGEVLTILRSDGSPDKAKPNGFEELTAEAEASVKQELNRIYDAFVFDVNQGRAGKVQADALTGGMYTAPDALAKGLADQIGTLEDAIALVASMATGAQKPIKGAVKTMSKVEGLVEPVAEVPEVLEGLPAAVTEQVAAVEALASEAEAKLGEAQARVTALEVEVTEVRGTVTALEATNVALEAEVATLRAWKAESKPATAGASDEVSGGNQTSHLTEVDAEAQVIRDRRKGIN
jgi:ClpP class serine protease